LKYPVRNIIYEKVKQAGNITDTDLMRALEKEDNSVSWPDFNKVSHITSDLFNESGIRRLGFFCFIIFENVFMRYSAIILFQFLMNFYSCECILEIQYFFGTIP
jgi:hypothetical protein